MPTNPRAYPQQSEKRTAREAEETRKTQAYGSQNDIWTANGIDASMVPALTSKLKEIEDLIWTKEMMMREGNDPQSYQYSMPTYGPDGEKAEPKDTQTSMLYQNRDTLKKLLDDYWANYMMQSMVGTSNEHF